MGASVSTETRRKVEKAAKELGYEPNALAASLTTGRTKLIGLVSNAYRNPVFLEIFDLFTRTLQSKDLRPLLVNLSDETDAKASMRMLRRYSVDGIIVASSTFPPSFHSALQKADVPIVHAFGRHRPSPDVHVVSVDNFLNGQLAARTFYERGYRRVGFMGGPEIASSTQDRLKGFLDQCGTYPDMLVSISHADAFAHHSGYNEMNRLLKCSPSEAYFCGDDALAIGAMAAIADAGLKVPDNIGVLGVNDMEIAGWTNINLTTIKQPIKQIVETSVHQVVRLLGAPDTAPDSVAFESTLIERGTLRPLPDGAT